MTPTLTLQCLTKTYAGQPALSDVSLTVAAGERVALLGHNGAGKSTMMKIILGLIPHDSGSLQVTGAAAGSPEARRNVAYLPENAAFHPALAGLASEGASILLSSHALTEVEARTDRIIILSGGVLVAEGALADLRRKADLPVSFQITPKPGFETDLAAALPQATPLSGYLWLSCRQDEKLPLMARITALADN